jgi:hypothetical protein
MTYKLGNLMPAFCAVILLTLLFSCNSTDETSSQSEKNKAKVATHISILSSDFLHPSFVVHKTAFRMMAKEQCNLSGNSTVIEEQDFFDSHIAYFTFDTLSDLDLNREEIWREILLKSAFVNFEVTSFMKQNFKFSNSIVTIPTYGICYWGEYFFPSAPNIAQRTATIMINEDRKQGCILDFDKIELSKLGLRFDFNIRGKHNFGELYFSDSCNKFLKLVR